MSLRKDEAEIMNLNELRRYVLTHREDTEAFKVYLNRSKEQMISIDLNEENWEEKVKEAIKYSSNAIRWYCDNTEKYQKEALKIIEWWKSLDNKITKIHHITGIKIDMSGAWKPVQMNPPIELIIKEPILEIHQFSALLQYKVLENQIYRIEADAIDLDINKQNLFVWPSNSPEVFIFSLTNT